MSSDANALHVKMIEESTDKILIDNYLAAAVPSVGDFIKYDGGVRRVLRIEWELGSGVDTARVFVS